jgi:hypothetical protein
MVATQGDSIILGFHTPLDAIRAALQAQQALLAAKWPEELLEHPLCKPQCFDSFEHGMFPLWNGGEGGDPSPASRSNSLFKRPSGMSSGTQM